MDMRTIGIFCAFATSFALAWGAEHPNAGVGGGGLALSLPPLPAAVTPFKPLGHARQDVRVAFETVSSTQWGQKGKSAVAGVYGAGDKQVTTCRDGAGRPRVEDMNGVIALRDGKPYCRLSWWGAHKGGFGYPFPEVKDAARLVVDKTGGATRYERAYLGPDGTTNAFVYTLRPLAGSRVELTWDSRHAVSLWVGVPDCDKVPLAFGGRPFTHASRVELEARRQAKRSGVTQTVKGAMRFWPDDDRKGLTLEFDDACVSGGFTEELDRWSGAYGGVLRLGPGGTRGRVVFDLGETAVLPKDVPPPVEGIDFWKSDATHRPLPPGRNLVPNPSFEQGMRYWSWTGGGAAYTPVTDETIRYWTSTGGYHGSTCLLLRDTGYPRRGGPAGPCLMPIPTRPGETYTFSFYAKAKRANTRVSVLLASAGSTGQWPWYPSTRLPENQWTVTDRWARYSRTFVADGQGVTIHVAGGGDTRIDCLQLELGGAATPWEGPPTEGLLVTAKRGNDLAPGEDPRARFVVRGEPAEIGLSARNVFGEELFRTNLAVTPPAAVPLAFDANRFGTGVFVLRADFRAKGRSWTDYFRLSVMEPLRNEHATKNVFGSLIPSAAATLTRGDDISRKGMEWGWGSTTWGSSDDYLPRNGAPSYRNVFEPRDRIGNFCRVLAGDDPATRDYLRWDAVTPERERAIEAAAYRLARTNDARFVFWTFGNEEESCVINGAKRFDEYAKAQAACRRGVKRARPDAKFLPTCGTSGWNRLRGYDAMEGYLSAADRLGFKYDAVAVHPYGNLDGGILGRGDMDLWTQKLLEMLDRHGYPKTTPIVYSEMWNIPETNVPEWGTDCYDTYQYGKISYDFGLREFVHAGSLARLYVMALKYWPRLEAVNVWMGRPFIDQLLAPIAACGAVNALGHMMPDVAFAADVKPYADVRGYVFTRRTDGRAVAAVWTTDHETERGRRGGPVLHAALPGGVRAYDFMGNRRALAPSAPEAKTFRLPLQPAPTYLVADDAARLADALNAAAADGAATWASVDASDPNADAPRVAAVHAERPDWTKIPSARAGGAEVRFAWNRDGLRLRVTASGPFRVGFDCGANGRANRRVREDVLDEDDYVYAFAPPADGAGRGTVTRERAVYHQLADGVNMPSRQEAAEKVEAAWRDGACEIRFAQRYLEPLMLRAGFTAGCGVYAGDALPPPSEWPLLQLRETCDARCP